MGCCISKCKPRVPPQFNPSVQDKLVISQSPPHTPSYPPISSPRKRKTIQSPPSTTTSASFASSTQISTCGSSSLSSVSSCSSSVAFSKVDRTFSNDFLQSCALENPQIIGLDPIKKIGVVKQISPGTTHKRARASSPTLTRQKSFRIEKERLPYGIVNGRTTMTSPSPSRRFNGNTSNYQRQPMLSSMNTHNESNRVTKAYTRPASPNRNVINKERPMFVKNKERFGYEVGSKVEVKEVLSRLSYSGSAATEDLDNPHIALDCFIFL
ncbi:hypothetical protein HanRHA438_Chr09g0399691 [Helianthus annuus]|nr:hypothetical protein HanIR_Chr09g0418531 [Helianthus annuus]KAJ0542432.1 hypothetical protein HanHA89_Chr09g0339661 [Helianthus annuus]KAJ0707471.1 hypothetical protein HanLR1_Chr09g0318781 [Helianthus annuus]KAJ0711479.1 hypothetical protein HanOQP8_Chr09g0324291 [Helianthus annuus]KAJ0888230.1 hypothetical protein HanRHA438_Chr09g0399691 [Helianthus annuus]